MVSDMSEDVKKYRLYHQSFATGPVGACVAEQDVLVYCGPPYWESLNSSIIETCSGVSRSAPLLAEG